MLTARWLFLVLVGCSCATEQPAQGPPQGWRSWNAFYLDISQARILQQAAALRRPLHGNSTLADSGYLTVGIDDGWQACGAGVNGSFHDVAGRPLLNLTRFPDMAAMNRAVHRMGLKSGWYLNNCWCNERLVGGGANVAQDAAATQMLGFDAVKIDGCGPAHDIHDWATELSGIAIENCGDNPRGAAPALPSPMPPQWAVPTPVEVLERCEYQMFRVSADIAPQFESIMYNLQQMVPYLDEHLPASRPGCWAYPDMLMLGNPSLSDQETRTHFAAWCIVSAPLVLGFDLSDDSLLRPVWDVLTNPRALAINQQYAGHPGRLLTRSSREFEAVVHHGAENIPERRPEVFPVWQLWLKPQPEGQVAVLLINLSNQTLELKDMVVSYAAIGFKEGSSGAVLTEVWSGAESVVPAGSVGARLGDNVPARGNKFVLLTPHDH